MLFRSIWPRLLREEDQIKRLAVDPHSPNQYRVNGVVKNIPQFIKAFDVKAGDKMYLSPDEQIKIW